MGNLKDNSIGGILFIGCLFLGIGIGMVFNQVGAGTIVGMGVGFILMAFTKKKSR